MRTLFLFILALPQMLQAEVLVRSPFYFQISPEDYKTVIEKYEPLKETSASHIDQIVIASPYKTVIQNIDLSFSSTAVLTPKEETGHFSFSIDIPGAQAHIAKIVTDDVIKKSYGGAQVSVYLHGECSNLNLQTASSNLKVTGDLEVVSQNGRLVFQLQRSSLEGAAAWNVNTESCSAPAGYQQLLEKEILRMMSENSYISDLVQKNLGAAVEKVSGQLNDKILKIMSSQLMDGVQLVVSPSAVDMDVKSGWLLIHGEVVTKIASDKSSADYPVNVVMDKDDEALINTPGLLLSQEYVQEVIKHLAEEGYVKYNFTSDKLNGFQSLLNNRFFQLFLWSDLRHFAFNSIFNFKASVKADSKVDFMQSSQGAAFYKLNGDVVVDMDAPKENSYVPYMNFSSNVEVISWVQVFKGKLYMGLYEPRMNLKAAWDKDYLARYKVSKSINSGFINGKIKKAVNGVQKNLPLPQLDLNSVVMKAQSLKSNKKWLQVIYQPVAK